MGLKIEELIIILALIALSTLAAYALALYVNNRRLRQENKNKEDEL